MLYKHALQRVLAVSASVSASRSGALRLGSLLGPTTTAVPLSRLTLPWRSQGLRRQTDTLSPRSTAPPYRRHRARRGSGHRDPFLALLHAGTALASAPLDRCPRGTGPRGGPEPLTAEGITEPRGRRMPAPAHVSGLEAVPGRALRLQGQRVVCARVCPVTTGTGDGPLAHLGAGVLPIRHDKARVAPLVGPRDLADHTARA
jgi:hypothetical protein